MNRITTRLYRALLLATFLLPLAAVSTQAAAINIDWQAASTTMTMPDGTPVTMWGFAPLAQPPFNPGPPVIRATAGDVLTITLTNNLTVPTSIVINGQKATELNAMVPTWTDGTNGSRVDPAQRVRSFTHETAPAASVAYEWGGGASGGLKAGTYLVQSGTHPSVQVPMGLYAVLIVDEISGNAYDAPTAVPYDSDVVLLFSEVDPALNMAVATGTYGTAVYPTALAMGYTPKYFLINGQPFSAASPPIAAGAAGGRLLLRFLNAGLRTRVPVIQGAYVNVVAEDGNAYNPVFGNIEQYSLDLLPAKTMDAILDPAPSGYLAVYDRRLGLTNSTSSPGGFYALLQIGVLGPFDPVLTVAKTGAGTVTATGVPATLDWGINCGPDCTQQYLAGTVVTLQAAPDPNSVFAGWNGGGCTGMGDCVLTMNADTGVNATFQAFTGIFEKGEVVINHNWTTVNLANTYMNPVVIAKPLSKNGGDPAVVRLKNVTGTSFDIRVQEWNYLDQWHLPETVSYMVMEAGHYVLDNGLHVEAGMVNTNKANANNPFETVIFASPFPGANPVVATTVMTFAGGDTVATRNRNITQSGFETVMQEQEGLDHVHVTETIGYIAWEPGTGTTGGTTYEVGMGGLFTHLFRTLNYGYLGSPTPPILIMDMQTTYGRDTANLRYINKGLTSVRVQVYEERSRDTETIHIPEEVGYFAFQ